MRIQSGICRSYILVAFHLERANLIRTAVHATHIPLFLNSVPYYSFPVIIDYNLKQHL